MSLSFSNFTVQETANTRQSGRTFKRGQSFKFRFRKFIMDKGKEEERTETLFQLSNELFESTGLSSSANGGLQIVSPEGVPYIAVVARDNGTFLKHSDKAIAAGNKKGTAFKSTILEDALVAQGLIVNDDSVIGKSQKLDLIKVAENVSIGAKGIQASAVYQIVKDENTEEVSEEDEAEAATDSESEVAAGDPSQESSAYTAESANTGLGADEDDDF